MLAQSRGSFGRTRLSARTISGAAVATLGPPTSGATGGPPGLRTQAAQQSYALRECSRALLAGSKAALASCSQVAVGGDRWLLTAGRGHLGGTGPQCIGRVLGGAALSHDRPFFRPDISRVGADRACVMRCRWSLLAAVGCCCCCHRCCQPLVLFPISEVDPAP
jgi:hypothetical protein